MKIERTCVCGAKISVEDDNDMRVDSRIKKWLIEHQECNIIIEPKCDICFAPRSQWGADKTNTEYGVFCNRCGARSC